MQTIRNIDLKGKRVFVRVDFNVPLNAKRQITDDTRIRAALPTLTHVLENQGRLIVASHLGRPKGQVKPEFSLAPVAERLSELLDRPVAMAPDCIGPAVEEMAGALQDGQVVLLENLRFHAAEQADEDNFGNALAALCDVYINDAFAVSHRRNASVAAITQKVAVKGAGFLLERELAYFDRAMQNPQRPLVAVVGGAKVSSKLTALTNMLARVDKIIIGGAMANTFLKSQGVDVGGSKVETDLLETAAQMMADAAGRGIRFYIPVDVVAADRFDAAAVTRIVPAGEIPAGWMALDIGPATARLYDEVLQDAKTVVWNGPLGVFEMDAFSRGTMAMAQSMAGAHAMTVIGGGDTNAAVHQAGLVDEMTYMSTGGGAFLSLLEGKTLPAVAALG